LAFEFLGIARCGAGIQFGEDFFERHATLAEGFAVQRKTVGTAMIWRSLTSSWNSAPSIITLARCRG
jgi:hypothetical protein